MNTLRKQIDELIDWYAKFKPDAGKKIPVNVDAEALAKALSLYKAGDRPPVEQQYRGRILVAAKSANASEAT